MLKVRADIVMDGEHNDVWGAHAAASPGYHCSKSGRSVPSRARVRVCRSQIPTHHFVQAQAQLAVTGFAANDVAALLAGIGFRIYTIPRDDAFISLMIEALAEFWGYVQRREPPPPTTYDDVCKRFPQHVALPIEADDATAT